MKTKLLVILSTLLCVNLYAQTCFTTIRVGTACTCHSCTGTVDVLSYETYVKRVLPQEWLNCWGSQANGMNSLQAGAVAIRSYTIPRVSQYAATHGANYDICGTTCCHAYGTAQFTNSNNAVDNTANMVLVNGNTIQLSEYAAEQNNHPACGNGYVGNGTSAWPCIADPVCSGQSYNGHGRGMCQNGSARWATGMNFVNSSCTWQSAHGYGTKTWQQILSHYYPNWTLTTCTANNTGTPNLSKSTDNITLGTNSFTVSAVIANTGPGASAASSVGFYVSTSSTFSSGITYVGSAAITALQAGGTATINQTISLCNLGLANGTYYIGYLIDYQNTVAESDENDNGYWYWGSSPIALNCATNCAACPLYDFSYTPTISWQTHTSSHQASACKTYRFAVTNGNIYTFKTGCGDGATANYDTYLELYNSNCTSILTDDDGCANPTATSTITWTATYTGNVYLQVKGFGTSSGNYTLAYNYTAPCTPPTAFSTTGTLSACLGSTTNISISASNCSGCTFQWNHGANGANQQLAPGNYTVTATNNGGCSATASVTIATAPAPDVPALNVTGNCAPVTVTASNNNCNLCSYDWSTPLGSANGISVQGTLSGSYSVTAFNSSNCTASNSTTVNIQQVPQQPGLINGAVNICTNNSATYSINPVPGATGYTWYLSAGGTITSGQGSAAVIVNWLSAGANTLSVTANNSCGNSAVQTMSVTVNQTPSVYINPAAITICAGGTGINLEAVGAAQNYLWAPVVGLNNTAGATVTANPANTTTYTVTAANGSCSATATSTVTVANQLIASINPSAPQFCSNTSVALWATQGTGYSWAGPNGFFATTQAVSAVVGGNYSVTVTNPGGCSGTAVATVNVTETPAPVANAGTAQVIAPGNSATLGGMPTAGGGTPPYSYAWQPQQYLNNPNAPNPTATPAISTVYSVTVTDGNGCSATDSIIVSVVNCQSYFLSNDTVYVPYNAAVYDSAVFLTTAANCSWSVIEGCSWLNFAATNGAGSGFLSLAVTQNNQAPRTCVVNVANTFLFVTQDGFTDINEAQAGSNIYVFPNPNQGVFTISITNAKNYKAHFKIYSSSGEIIYNEWLPANGGKVEKAIKMKEASAGIYLLAITINGTTTYKKLLVL